MRRIFTRLFVLSIIFAPQVTLAEGDVRKGAELYRACVACHALEPGLHLSGPSLADVWNRPAGEVSEFTRYSDGLRDAGFLWDAVSLDAWLESPSDMIEGTTMTFRGIADTRARADLIAFLERAGSTGGAEALVDESVIPASYLRAQAPQPLSGAPDYARVVGVRHCAENFVVETADGVQTKLWEKNLRLKVDSMESGPVAGAGVILRAGMQGDRFTVIFASLADLKELVVEDCPSGASGEESQ